MTTITALPPAPDRDDSDTFDTLADAFVAALPPMVTEINLVAGEVNANAVAAAASAVTADAQADLATTNGALQVVLAATQASYAANSAITASGSLLASGVIAWVSGNTYTSAQPVFSPIDYQTYRRKTTGSGVIDPSLDSANWAVNNGLPSIVNKAGKQLSNDGTTISWKDTLPIGAIMPFYGQSDNIVEVGDTTWLRTGKVVPRASYPNGPACISWQGASTDGTGTSYSRALPVSGNNFTSFTNGKFITTNSTDIRGIWTSTDGLTWDYARLPFYIGVQLGFCAYGAGVYVFQVVGTANVWVSSDLVDFTSYALPNTGYAHATEPCISFANSLFVFTCGNASVAYLYTSTNGTAWTQRTLPAAAIYFSPVYGLSKWVVIQGYGVYSTDGITWNACTGIATYAPNGIVFANSRFLANSDTTTVMWSSIDGIAFTNQTTPAHSTTVGAPVWDGTNFVISASGGASVLKSTTGATGTWSTIAVPGLASYTACRPISNGAGAIVMNITSANVAPMGVTTDSFATVWGYNNIANTGATNVVPTGTVSYAVAQFAGGGDYVYHIQRHYLRYHKWYDFSNLQVLY